MFDKDFFDKLFQIKDSHEKFLTAILSSDVFPGLDVRNPLEQQELDDLPLKFKMKEGNPYYKESVQIMDEKESFKQMLENDQVNLKQLESMIDWQKRIIFTEIRIRVKQEQ